MFSVIFAVHPKAEQWDAYLGNAKIANSIKYAPPVAR
jgi:hypothetical protein